MKSIVLRPFDYSFDGVRALKALVDQKIDFLDMTDGLTAEGYVAPTEDDETVDVVVAEVVATEPAVETSVTGVEPVTEPVIEPTTEPAVVVEMVVESEVVPEPVIEASTPTAKRKRR